MCVRAQMKGEGGDGMGREERGREEKERANRTRNSRRRTCTRKFCLRPKLRPEERRTKTRGHAQHDDQMCIPVVGGAPSKASVYRGGWGSTVQGSRPFLKPTHQILPVRAARGERHFPHTDASAVTAACNKTTTWRTSPWQKTKHAKTNGALRMSFGPTYKSSRWVQLGM